MAKGISFDALMGTFNGINHRNDFFRLTNRHG
jgi:hypothetical protein